MKKQIVRVDQKTRPKYMMSTKLSWSTDPRACIRILTVAIFYCGKETIILSTLGTVFPKKPI